MSDAKAQWDKVTALNIAEQVTLGPIYTELLLRDPKCLSFILSRYKFAAKMLRHKRRIIEVGSGEGIGALLLVGETQGEVYGVDFDRKQIERARQSLIPAFEAANPARRGRLVYEWRDFGSDGADRGLFDGLVCLDVIEHVPHGQEEDRFIANCADALNEGGAAVIGTPSLQASAYASERSRIGHVNLFAPDRFVAALQQQFRNVFLFSMNDEMVHTGFDRMAHYLMALCVK